MSNDKPGNQERLSLTENHEKRKNQDFKLKKEKKRKRERERERERKRSTLRLSTRNTTQPNSGQKAKKYSEHTAHFRRLANGKGD
jgi:hypothetical protein